MRLTWLHLAFSIAPFGGITVNAEHHALLPRQDSTPSPSPSSTSSTAPTSSAIASTSSHDTAQSSNGGSSTSASAGLSSPSAPSSTSQPAKTTLSTSASKNTPSPTSDTASVVSATPTASGISPVPANDTTKGDPQALPIPPSITPALCVAGAILMTTGIFYTLLGIKTKWLHVFLSAAYLTSLGVTILIVYVINPPISDAKQGAYLSAAVITGVVFGGGSVIFPDVAEGLGCFLGGFCFSMWLMVLKPGGLITSTAGKAIFISGFTAAGFAVYVSHYTRTYGIIGCASFAGATAIVLGIDCFSRAGLKEFWLYIWNLNNALLPPHYNDPYPITRGIRVEIAGIVLLCAIGIMSQMKVWNIVKKRREDRAAAKNLERQRQDEAEEELGRKLEEGKERERITWEAVYGGNGQKRGQHIDSGIGTDEPGSIRKGSTSVRTVEMPRSGDASIEMNRLGPGKGSSTQGPREGRQDGRVTVRVASGDEIFALPPIDFGEFRDTLSWKGETAQASKPPSISKSPPEEPRKESPEVQVTEVSVPVVSEAAERLSKMPAAEVSKPDTIEEVERPGEPQIIPLPFRIPDADMENDNDGSSVATFAASDRRFSRMSKRMSGASLLMSPSKRSESHSWGVSNASEEALMIPYVDDDKASSLAATVDGVSDRDSDDDIDSRSRRVSELDNAHKETLPDQSMPATEIGGDWFQSNGSDQTDNIDGKPSSGAGEAPGMSSAPLLELPKQDQEHHVRDLSESPSRELSSGEGPLMGEHTKSATESNALGKRPMRTLSGRLPDDASKVVMAYRTNEWAKHLEQADLPKLDELNEPINVPAEAVAAKEAPVPVLVEELQQTPLTAEPLPVINATKMGARERLSKAALSRLHLSKTQSPYQNAAQQPKDPNRPSNSGNGARPPLLQQQPSESLQSQDRPPQPAPGQSQLSLNTNRNHRSSSTPLTSQPFAESPIEEDVEASFPPRFTPSPMHLMSKRDKLVRNKPSSTSLLKFDSTPNPTPPLHSSASDSSSLHGGVGDMDQDNIPLSHRKSLLRAQKRSSAPLQPCRSSSTPLQNARDSTIAAWRSTLQPSSNSPLTHAHLQNQTQGVSLEKRREELLREKRRASASAAVNEKAKGMRESVLEQGMRRGDMLEAHREAMRRMQAGANRRL